MAEIIQTYYILCGIGALQKLDLSGIGRYILWHSNQGSAKTVRYSLQIQRSLKPVFTAPPEILKGNFSTTNCRSGSPEHFNPGLKIDGVLCANLTIKRRNSMNVKPLSDRIIIQPLEAEQKTTGGIIIPDNAKEKPQKGEVIAVGTGKVADNGQKIEMTLKAGDKVLYGKYSGTEVSIDGKDLLIMRESDVLAKL
jgi:chaperonin GroES